MTRTNQHNDFYKHHNKDNNKHQDEQDNEDKKQKFLLMQYLQTLVKFSPRKISLNLLLMLFLGLVEGISIVMIIPLLSLAGIIQLDTVARVEFLGNMMGFFDNWPLHIRLLAVLVVYFFIIASYSLLYRYQSVLNASIQHGFTSFLNYRLHRAFSFANWSFISNQRQSDMSQIFTTEINRVGNGTLFLLQLIITVIMIIIQLTIAFYLSTPLTLLVLLCGSILFVTLYPLLKHAKQMGQNISRYSKGIYAQLAEHLGAIKEVKSYGAEQQYLERYAELVQALEQNNINFVRINTKTNLFYKTGAALVVSIFFYVAIVIMKSHPEELLLMLVVFSRLWPRFNSFQSGLQRVFMMLPAFNNVVYFEKSCLEAVENIDSTASAGSPVVLREGIEFRNVSFRYASDSEQYAVKDADFYLAAFSTVALVGPSGAGKSTLTDLLLGLLKPEKGEILLDGSPLTDDKIPSWRQQIAYVPQSPFLFNTSIRNNLLWANPEAGEEDLWDALRTAAAAAFVAKLPEGLDTVIGDQGVKLSGGEGQRIVLARALLKNPSVLILDEATNALDLPNENKIFQAMEELHRRLTIIIITHRLSAIRNADKVITIDDGRIVNIQ